MNHDNRGRLTVDFGGNWRLYTATLPSGSIAIGTVTQGIGITGALVKLASGIHVRINAGVVKTLDDKKLAAALAAGKKEPGQR